MRRLLLDFALVALLGLSGSAFAQPIAIQNASFEDDFAPAGGFPVFVPSGWQLYDPGLPGNGQGIVNFNNNAVGVLNPSGTSFFVDPVPHGSNVALIYLEQVAGTTQAGKMVGLSQTLTGATLQVNTRYTLNVAVGNIASGTGLGAYAGFGFADLSGFPGYRVELLAGGQVVAADDNSLAIGEGRFATSSVVFDTGASHALAGQVLGIRLINLNATGNLNERGREVDFDAVSLVAAPVPEPQAHALWLAGLGLMATAAMRRRRP